MKRAAADAFAPVGNAMFDPKAYFAQFQQAAMNGQSLSVPGTVAPAAAAVASTALAEEKSELHIQVESKSMSAVRCAAIVKEKGNNFTTVVAIAALTTMSTKSSYKLREDLLRQPHVKKLCERVQKLLAAPSAGLPLDLLAQAAWSLVRFPNEVMGTPSVTLGPLAKMLAAANPGTGWQPNTASQVLFCLTKGEIIVQYKVLVSQVVKELVRDNGLKVGKLSHEELVNMLSTISKARVYIPNKDEKKQKMSREMIHVRCEANDEAYFQYASKRICAESGEMDVRLVATVAHIHSEAGIRDEKLFKAVCPRIMEKSKDLDEKSMGRAIKAYARFMIPLREEAQGFRTMAVIAKGDFIRPSDKPKKTGPRTFDQPIPLYEKTQLHSRG